MEEIRDDVQVLWDYLCLKTKSQKSECIIGLGSILTMVPKKCAELYHQGIGEYIVFSGNCGKGTEGVITKTEAELFKEIAVSEGVPAEKILIETKATTTYENYKYTKLLLKENNLEPTSFTVVGKPYQERRAFNIAKVELAGKKFEVDSFTMTLELFLKDVMENNQMTQEDVINELVGEINLIMITPAFGLQSHEEIPEKVQQSYQQLVSRGFDTYVYSEEKARYFVGKMKEKGLF